MLPVSSLWSGRAMSPCAGCSSIPHSQSIITSHHISNLLNDPYLSASVSQHKRTRQLHELARQEARVTSEDLMELLVLVSRLEQLTRSLYTR